MFREFETFNIKNISSNKNICKLSIDKCVFLLMFLAYPVDKELPSGCVMNAM